MVVKTLNMVNNCQILGPVAQLGQSVGLLIQWSRDRSPSGPPFTNKLFIFKSL
jgi:hypothetical protein